MPNRSHLSPLTYWVWRTVAEHGPISTDKLRALLPEMPHDRLSMRLFNLRSMGYICAARGAGRYATFSKGHRTPEDVDGLEQLLAENLVFQGKAEDAAQVKRARRAEPTEPPAPLPVPLAPLPVGPSHLTAAAHNHWLASAHVFGQRPPVVRAGSLDALRLASRQFGRAHHAVHQAERSLGVVEAGGCRG